MRLNPCVRGGRAPLIWSWDSSVSVLTRSGTTCNSVPVISQYADVSRYTLWPLVRNRQHEAGIGSKTPSIEWLPGNRAILAGKLLNSCQLPPLFSSTDRYYFIARVCKSSTPHGDFLLVASLRFERDEAFWFSLIQFQMVCFWPLFCGWLWGGEKGRWKSGDWFFNFIKNFRISYKYLRKIILFHDVWLLLFCVLSFRIVKK